MLEDNDYSCEVNAKQPVFTGGFSENAPSEFVNMTADALPPASRGERDMAKVVSGVNGDVDTFAHSAETLRRAGWAVCPSRGKAPIMKNFPKWKTPLGADAVARQAKRNPDAEIVIIAGLTRTKTGRGLITVDADDMETASRIEGIFGPTPCMTVTRRGLRRRGHRPEGRL